MHSTDRLLKIGEVVAITALSESSIYRKMRRGQFPQPIKGGARAVRWWLSEILAWLARCPRAKGDLGDTTNNNWEDESTGHVSRCEQLRQLSRISGPGAQTAQRP